MSHPMARASKHLPGVEKEQLQILSGAEHEHIGIEPYFRDRTARQRVSVGDEADVLIAILVCSR